MFRLSARWRINIGLVGLLLSVILVAISLGMVPDWRQAKMDGRAQLCETLAVSSSILVTRDNYASVEELLQVAVRRNREMHSAAVLHADGHLIAQAGGHQQRWLDVAAQQSTDFQATVPIWSGAEKWGELQVCFQPLIARGALAFVHNPWTRFVLFVAAASSLMFAWYLWKMLQHLDPSRAVPGRVRSALDTLAEGLVVLDGRERIVLANQAFAGTVEESPDKLLGRKLADFDWSGEDAENETLQKRFPWSVAIKQGVAQEAVMLRLSHGGNQRTFMANCSPVLGHDGKYHGVLVSFEDVTQLEEKKVELSRSMAVAEAANRAKSEFLANMSHEIRTPMNAILGFTDVLRRGMEKNTSKRHHYLNTIHSSGEHLLALINDILDLSKVEAGRLEVESVACAPQQIVSEVLAVLTVKAQERGIFLRYEPEGELPETIVTDPGRVRQTLMNLVGNAVKFTETGGVRVVTRLVRDGGKPQLAFDVIDSGIGMTPETQAKIFKPFAQADGSVTRRFGGTGLGLTISRRFAAALGGQLAVSSEFGKGSVFTLTVDTGPLEAVKMLSAEEALRVETAAPSSQTKSRKLPPARILVVDDGEENRELMTLVLREAGVEVETAENGQIAVQHATTRNYDVILMDMQMPVMDGYTAASTLRGQGYAQPIFALTANAMKGDEEKCRAAGCSGFLPKPIKIDVLIQALADVLGEPARAEPETASPATAEPADTPAEAESKLPAEPPPAEVLVSSLPTHKPQFAAIVRKFVVRLAEQLEAMDAAFAQQDFTRLAQLAHWLKGSGGNVGFAELAEPARELEVLAKEQRTDEIGPAIARLHQLATRIEVPPEPQLQPAGS